MAQSQVMEYKCPCCGGKIEFDSGLQKMKCPFCDTEFEMQTLKDYDQVLSQQPEEQLDWDTDGSSEWQEGETDGMSVYTCHSCGGEIVCDQTTAATHCPFCGNPVIMTGRFSGALRPDYVIPFKLDKEAAKVALRQHLQGKRLLPKAFKEENHIDEVKGVYVPFWLFDSDADAGMRYRGTRVRVWSDSRYNYTDTSFYAITRRGSLSFEHIPVDGSSKIDNHLTESLEPFDFSQAVDFQTAYLSGYLADKYDVTAEQSVDRANERIKKSTQNEFYATVQGYNTVENEECSIQLKNGKSHYALYPVWLLTTTWNGKQYLFAMNGQTGKFVGDLPLDKGAYWKWFGGITAAVGAVVYLLLYLFWLL